VEIEDLEMDNKLNHVHTSAKKGKVDPNFINIGAPRSGSTWVAKNLRAHPEIFMPTTKELHFFDKEYFKGIEYYQHYFRKADSARHKAIGEATPAYFWRDYVSRRIKEHYPNIKLIAIIRDPIDRAYSHYWKLIGRNEKILRGMNFSEALKLEKIMRKMSCDDDDAFAYVLAPGLIEAGKYYDHLAPYYDQFPKNNILVLIYEELKQDPYGGFQTLYRFLGVDEEFESPWASVQVNAASKMLGKFKVLDLLQRVFMKTSISSVARVFGRSNINSIPPMQEYTRKQLEEEFDESNRRLAVLLGRNLDIWNK